MKKILMIVGSLRNNSLNMQLARIAEEMLAGKARVSFLDYADIPFMNQDIEYPAPESVSRVRQIVKEADAVWFFTPEYNYYISGVLKNLLDWLSRTLQPNDMNWNPVLKEKPAVISSVAGKGAGEGARKNLSSLLEILAMNVVGNLGIAADGEVFQSDKLEISEESRRELRELADQLMRRIEENSVKM